MINEKKITFLKKKLVLNLCYLKLFNSKNFYIILFHLKWLGAEFNFLKKDYVNNFIVLNKKLIVNHFINFINFVNLVSKLYLNYFFSKFKIIINLPNLNLFSKNFLFNKPYYYSNRRLVSIFLKQFKNKRIIINNLLVINKIKKRWYFWIMRFYYRKPFLKRVKIWKKRSRIFKYWLKKRFFKKFKFYKYYRRIILSWVINYLKLNSYYFFTKYYKFFLFNSIFFFNLLRSTKLVIKFLPLFKKKLLKKNYLKHNFKINNLNYNLIVKKTYMEPRIIQIFTFLWFNIEFKRIRLEVIDINKFIFSYLKICQYFQKILNLTYKNYYYCCYIKKTRSNLFITIVNRIGDVIISYSSGKRYDLKKKKGRKSFKSLPFLIDSISKKLLKKNIKYLYKLYLQNNLKRFYKQISKSFLKNSIKIIYFIYIKNRAHGFPRRSKKSRRL